jgi:ribosomal small subunit protein bTHX
MGKGDRRTRKGKTYISSYGNKRPHRVRKAAGAATAAAAPAAKPAAKKVAAPKKKA